MRNFLFFIFLLSSLNITAQGNLQFNQVLLLSATTNNAAQWSVPVGKVWKIEALGAHSPYTYVYLNNQIAFEHNGPVSSTSGGYYRHSASSPIWLPEGTILGHVSGSSSAYRWFSIIEFNIVP
jgi:hypothetical protein